MSDALNPRPPMSAESHAPWCNAVSERTSAAECNCTLMNGQRLIPDHDQAIEALERLTADFNDCNAERARWKARAEKAERDLAQSREQNEAMRVAMQNLCTARLEGNGSIHNELEAIAKVLKQAPPTTESAP